MKDEAVQQDFTDDNGNNHSHIQNYGHNEYNHENTAFHTEQFNNTTDDISYSTSSHHSNKSLSIRDEAITATDTGLVESTQSHSHSQRYGQNEYNHDNAGCHPEELDNAAEDISKSTSSHHSNNIRSSHNEAIMAVTDTGNNQSFDRNENNHEIASCHTKQLNDAEESNSMGTNSHNNSESHRSRDEAIAVIDTGLAESMHSHSNSQSYGRKEYNYDNAGRHTQHLNHAEEGNAFGTSSHHSNESFKSCDGVMAVIDTSCLSKQLKDAAEGTTYSTSSHHSTESPLSRDEATADDVTKEKETFINSKWRSDINKYQIIAKRWIQEHHIIVKHWIQEHQVIARGWIQEQTRGFWGMVLTEAILVLIIIILIAVIVSKTKSPNDDPSSTIEDDLGILSIAPTLKPIAMTLKPTPQPTLQPILIKPPTHQIPTETTSTTPTGKPTDPCYHLNHHKYISTTSGYSRNGDLSIPMPPYTQEGDLLLLFLSRTDDVLPLEMEGWNTGPSCLKEQNGQRECWTTNDCLEEKWDWYSRHNYCRKFPKNHTGEDLGTVVFYRRVSAVLEDDLVTSSNSIATNIADHELILTLPGSAPSWGILTSIPDVDTRVSFPFQSPIRSSATTACDKSRTTIFPSVQGVYPGDIVLFHMAFDDAADYEQFMAPSGTEFIQHIKGRDEAGFLYGMRWYGEKNGQTPIYNTTGRGGGPCKDEIISLVVRGSSQTQLQELAVPRPLVGPEDENVHHSCHPSGQ